VFSLTDTHCHLDFNKFDDDREGVLARAWEAGLERILIPGIDLASSSRALDLARRDPRLCCAVGIHPNSANTWDGASLSELRLLTGAAEVVAIGEIGLDYYRRGAPPDIQRQVFESQLELAAELGLPVIVHNREATEDVLEVLAAWHDRLVARGSSLAERPGVLHSFSADGTAARRALEMNFRLGITGPITFKDASILRRLVRELPLECLLIETDAPFLSPHPRRGRRNEPAYVRFVAEKIAELRSLSPATVGEQTTRNANELFQW